MEEEEEVEGGGSHQDSQHLGSPLSRTSVDCQLEERERGVAWLRLLPPLTSHLRTTGGFYPDNHHHGSVRS